MCSSMHTCVQSGGTRAPAAQNCTSISADSNPNPHASESRPSTSPSAQQGTIHTYAASTLAAPSNASIPTQHSQVPPTATPLQPDPASPSTDDAQYMQASDIASTSRGYEATNPAFGNRDTVAMSSRTSSNVAPIIHTYTSGGSPLHSEGNAGAALLGSRPSTPHGSGGGSGGHSGSGSGGHSGGKTPLSYASSSAYNQSVSGVATGTTVTGATAVGNNGSGTSVLGVSQSGATSTSVLGISQQDPGILTMQGSTARGVGAGQNQLTAVVEQSESSVVGQSTLSHMESELAPTDQIMKPAEVSPAERAKAELVAAAAASAAAAGVRSPVGSPAAPTPLSPVAASRGGTISVRGGTITTIGGMAVAGAGPVSSTAPASSMAPVSSTHAPTSTQPPTSQSSLTPSSGPYPQKQPLSPQEMAAQKAKGAYPQVAPSSGHDRSSDDLLKLLNEQLNMLQTSDDGVILRRFRMSGVTSRRVGGTLLSTYSPLTFAVVVLLGFIIPFAYLSEF